MLILIFFQQKKNEKEEERKEGKKKEGVFPFIVLRTSQDSFCWMKGLVTLSTFTACIALRQIRIMLVFSSYGI